MLNNKTILVTGGTGSFGHHFVDYVLGNISQLNLFKDKTMGIDLKQYKNRLEATIEGFKKQTEEIITNNKVYTSKLINPITVVNFPKGGKQLYQWFYDRTTIYN